VGLGAEAAAVACGCAGTACACHLVPMPDSPCLVLCCEAPQAHQGGMQHHGRASLLLTPLPPPPKHTQVLVQYEDPGQAREAKESLDGKSIPKYLLPPAAGAAYMKVTYSAHSDLNVRFQSHRSRWGPRGGTPGGRAVQRQQQQQQQMPCCGMILQHRGIFLAL
jgi:hypothetical protein